MNAQPSTKHHYVFTFNLDPTSDDEQLNKTRSCHHFSYLNGLDFWAHMQQKVRASGPKYPNAVILSVKEITY